MIDREQYSPGPASGAQIEKDGENWMLVLVRELRHPPEKVWQALTDPAHLREWAPFEADTNLGTTGVTVKFTTVGAPTQQVTETTVSRAEAPQVLEYKWGGNAIRWQLEAVGAGTRLTLWHNIDRRFISMGAAGWHICLDVLERLLAGKPIGRMVGADVMKFGGWQRLNAEYAKHLVSKFPTGHHPRRRKNRDRANFNRLGQMGSANPPLAVHRLYDDRHRQLRFYGIRETTRLDSLFAIASSFLDVVNRPVHVRVAVCRQMARAPNRPIGTNTMVNKANKRVR